MKRLPVFLAALLLACSCAAADWTCSDPTCGKVWPDTQETCGECGQTAPVHGLQLQSEDLDSLRVKWFGSAQHQVAVYYREQGSAVWMTYAKGVSQACDITGLQSGVTYEIMLVTAEGVRHTVTGTTKDAAAIISDLEATVASQTDMIAALEVTVADREATIAEQSTRIAELEATVAEQQAMIAELATSLSSAQASLSEAQTALTTAQTRLAAIEAEIAMSRQGQLSTLQLYLYYENQALENVNITLAKSNISQNDKEKALAQQARLQDEIARIEAEIAKLEAQLAK